jgi:uncharacterized protein YmfQ (DUF2313 family)
MARSQAEALAGLLTLSPPGWALPADPASVWAGFLTPWAAECALIEAAAEALLPETDPRVCVNLLPDWQRLLGPDPYGRDAAALNLSVGDVARLTWQRLTAGGNMAPADYVALAAQSGLTVTITEYRQTQCGQAQCGQQICQDILTGGVWNPQQFKWLVTLPADLLLLAECGLAQCGDVSGAADPAAGIVAAAIAGEAPAHTLPVFSYAG